MRILFPADCQPVHANCRRSDRAAKLQIIRNLRNIKKQFLQIPRHRDLFHRIRELSPEIHIPDAPRE